MGGPPSTFDADAGKGRNVIERSFNVLKQWRGLAVRYDNLALTYRGGVVLGAIITWPRRLGDTPRSKWTRTRAADDEGTSVG